MKDMKMKNKLYLYLRSFDVYKGRNPLKLFLRWIACKMWDYQEARDLNMVFVNKKFTPCRKCGFFNKEKWIEITNGFLHFGVLSIMAVLILAVIIMLGGLGLGIFGIVKEFIGRN